MQPETMQPETEELDPLYEPAYAAFVYAAWALTTWASSPRTGLVVLVAATALLTTLALRHYSAAHLHNEPHPRGFLVDFGSTLLFCAAAIALGVLAIELFVEWPRVVVSVGMPMLAVLAALSVHAGQQRRGRRQLR
jgi:hypothetical protein